MAITPLPTPPSRTIAPATFVVDADNFLGALPDFGTEANELAVEVNEDATSAATSETNASNSAILSSEWASQLTSLVNGSDYSSKEYAIGDTAPSAKQYANANEDVQVEAGTFSAKHFSIKSYNFSEISKSVANFVGSWSDLTGSLSIPSSVYHNKSFWQLIQNISDVSTEEPSIGSLYWARIDSGVRGAEETTSADNIFLNSGNKIVQDLSFTEPSKSVFLPDATTILTGVSYFFYNSGGYTYLIRNNNLDLINYLEPKQSCMVSLVDNSTSQGTYKISTFDKFDKALLPNLAVVFESASTEYISVTRMTDDKAIVCYRDNGNSNYGTACILDISTGSIVLGSAVVFESASTEYISVTRMTDDKAIVCYWDGGNSNYGTACILDISTGSIVSGSAVVFESAITSEISVTRMTDDKAVVCYRDGGNSSYGTACILDISTGSIVSGSAVVFESASSSYTTVTRMTDDKAIVCYQDGGNSNYGTACMLDISTGTIVPDSAVVFESASSSYTTVTRMTDDKAIVCYRDGGNSNYGTACMLDISTGTIVPDSAVVFESANLSSITVTRMTDDKAIVCYSDVGNSNYGTSCILDISTGTIVPDSAVVFESASSNYISVTRMTDDKAIVCYRNGGNSNYGTATLLETVKS